MFDRGAKHVWLGLVAAIALFCLHVAMYRHFLIDDAFISFRYVQQWVAGHGLVYNIGERVEGYSNFLWIVILALPGLLGLDVPLAARILGFLLSLATMLPIWWHARKYAVRPFSVLLLAAWAPFAAWAVGRRPGNTPVHVSSDRGHARVRPRGGA